jgi:ABC-type multidrug transport system ATPase subunit
MTILFTTHNIFFVKNWADKMLFLHNGEKLYEGFPEKGLNNSTIMELVGSNQDFLDLIKKSKNKNL